MFDYKLLIEDTRIGWSQERMKQKEGRHRRTVRHTENRIVMWSAIELFTLVVMAIAQVSIVQKFFNPTSMDN